MERNLTARELTEWEMFDAIHGLPDKRAEIVAGTIAAHLYYSRPKKPGARKLKISPADFFPWLKPPKPAAVTQGGIPVGPSLERIRAVMLAAGGKPKVPDEHDSEPGSNTRA